MNEQTEKAKADFDAMVEKYKALKGKKFLHKSGKGRVATVVDYIGVAGLGEGVQGHIINVNNGDADWTPVASKFLEEHNEVAE
jgi:hypothetical protein